MPYGLFDFEDTIEPMGLSPQFNLSANTQQGRANLGLPILNKIPAPTPQNTGIVTKAIPENPPQQVTMAIPENAGGIPTTAQKFAYRGAENAPSQNITQATFETQPIVTDAMIGNEAPPNITLACIPSEGCNPNTPPMTPPNPSGQCPTGYQPSNQPSPIKPPSGGGAQFYDKQVQVGSGLGGGGGGLPKWNASQMAEVLGSRTPVSATAPNTWSGSQQQYTSMINQLGINTAR